MNNVFQFGSGYRLFCSSWWKHWLRPRTYWKPFHYAYQRVIRGWADCDTWSLDTHVAEVLSEAVLHLKENKRGFPSGLVPDDVDHEEGIEKWKGILRDISDGFKASLVVNDVPDEFISHSLTEQDRFGRAKRIYDWDAVEKYRAEKLETFHKGMDLFKQYFFNLWD